MIWGKIEGIFGQFWFNTEIFPVEIINFSNSRYFFIVQEITNYVELDFCYFFAGFPIFLSFSHTPTVLYNEVGIVVAQELFIFIGPR